MIDPHSQSYPYLAIAQRFNVDYGLVLTFADLIAEEIPPEHPQAKQAIRLPANVRHAIIELTPVKWSSYMTVMASDIPERWL